MADVKRVALPGVGFPAYPSVTGLNTVADCLGLVGLVAGEVIRNNRVDALKAIMVSQSFDPQAHFSTALTDRLQARGLAIAPEAADGSRRDFLKTYGTGADRDAVLDIYASTYGFIALSDASGAPFRASAGVRARLIRARDRSVLMQDAVAISGIDSDAKAPDGVSLDAGEFHDFVEIEANPGRAVAGLRGALSAAADGVAKRLT